MRDFSFIPCCNFQQRIRFIHLIIPGIGFIEYCLLSWLQVYSRKWKGVYLTFLHFRSYSTRTKDLDSIRKFCYPYSNILAITESISKYFFSFHHLTITPSNMKVIRSALVYCFSSSTTYMMQLFSSSPRIYDINLNIGFFRFLKKRLHFTILSVP